MVIADVKIPSAFLNEWQLLFTGDKVDDVKIQKYCLNGHLANSHVRSLAWRILLKVLPLRRAEWTKTLGHLRANYGQLSAKLVFDPREVEKEAGNPDIFNPLCVNGKNPWCLYFEDRRLREIIEKDVERTYPDIPFFQSNPIRDLMSNILFTYSKCHPQISYQQGMHELLAPIIFVLDLDQKVHRHLKEQNCLSFCSQAGFSYEDIHLLEALNNPNYLEHDAYSIFSQLMGLVSGFYLNKAEQAGHVRAMRSRANTSSASTFKDHLVRVPFSDVASNGHQELPSIHRRLEFIHDKLLMSIDPPLARHFAALQILPQLYGIRWLRLLFGREFSIMDLLTVWDVIFADDSTMIDHIFVALLVQVRHFLLRCDYSTCIQYLVKYPPVKDVGTFIRFVLFLKYPNRYPIPDAMTSYASYWYGRSSARTEWIWAKHSVQQPAFKQAEEPTRDYKLRALDSVLNKIGRPALSAHPPAQFQPAKRRNRAQAQHQNMDNNHNNDRNSPSSSSECSNSTRQTAANSAETNRRKERLESSGELELMKEQISLLQSRLNDVDVIGQISARKIRACADLGRMQTAEGQKRLIDELNEIAEQLTRSTVSEQYIHQHIQPVPSAVPSGPQVEAVEMASEVLGFGAVAGISAAGSSSTGAASTSTLGRSRLSSKTLPSEGNELIELRFDKKKNY